jgi:predicted phage terminase large subunit-like protein
MVLDVVEADIRRRVPDLIISTAIDLQLEYHCLAWGVETVQFQAFMYSELIKRAALRSVAFPGVPLIPGTDKELRIISLQPKVSNGLIRLHRSQTTLIEQLQFWPEADHDDGPDALEMLDTLARKYGGDWSYTSVGESRGDQRSGRNSNTNAGDDDD